MWEKKKIFEEVINSKNDGISKEFIKLKNLLYGYKNENDNSRLFYGDRPLYKSFVRQYVYNTVFLLEKDSAKKIHMFYLSLLKNIIELIIKIESKELNFCRLVKFCLLVYKNSNYSIEQFISNFVEGMNWDNEAILVGKQNPKFEEYLDFIEDNSK